MFFYLLITTLFSCSFHKPKELSNLEKNLIKTMGFSAMSRTCSQFYIKEIQKCKILKKEILHNFESDVLNLNSNDSLEIIGLNYGIFVSKQICLNKENNKLCLKIIDNYISDTKEIYSKVDLISNLRSN